MITTKNAIIRLSRYKSALARLRNLGFVKVFSDNLADAVGVTAAQVRKDFSLFGITGHRRGGYQIDALIEKLNSLLGKDNLQKVIVVGCGNIGSALMKYKGFEQEGIKIVAGFDSSGTSVKKSSEVPILSVDELQSFVSKHKIHIGVIAVPEAAAQAVLDQMVAAGIKGILNFAPIRLRAPENIVINNVNLVLELESVVYFTRAVEKNPQALVEGG